MIGRKKKGGKPCRWFRSIPLFVAAILFAFTLGSCSAMGDLFVPGEPTFVLADQASVPVNAQPPPVLTVLPVKEADGTDTGRFYVLVDEATLPPEAPRVPIASAPPPESGWISGISGMLAGTPLGPFAPVAGLLLAKLIATRRGRANGASAMKALAKLDVGGAAKGLLAADGFLHTSEVVKPPGPA
jgi:hypothetical protein